jgi:integrase
MKMKRETKLTATKIRRFVPSFREYYVWDTDTPYFGVRILPSGQLRFIHVVTTKDGRQIKTTIGDAKRMSLEKARAMARKLTAKFREGGFERNGDKDDTPNPSHTTPTFDCYVSKVWLPHVTPLHKPTTRKRDKQALQKQLIPAFGDNPLHEIDRELILKWFDKHSQSSPGGANRDLDVLSSILSHAVKADIITRNPISRIKRNKKRRMIRFLSAEERENLLRELDAAPKKYRVKALLIKMLLYTGCRLNEITGLLWSEIGEGVINLTDSKTGPRQVWIGDDEITILNELKTLQEDTGGLSKFAFANPKDKDRSIGNCTSFWHRIRTRVGIEDVRLHDLRHSFASEALRQGVSLPVLKKLMGHKDMRETLRYIHTSNKDAEAAAEHVGELINARLRGEG